MPSATGARLARAFLVYLLGVVVIVTLAPFQFRVPAHPVIRVSATVPDALANIGMFIPLGFLFRLTLPSPSDRWASGPLAAGLLLSVTIETVQLLLPARVGSPADVVTNGLGGWLGAMACDGVARRLQSVPRLVGKLALELPLMGLVYLLIPLLWVSALAADDRPARLLLLPLLGSSGAVVAVSLYRHRLGPVSAVGRVRFAGIVAAWFALGVLPALLVFPVPVAGAILLVGTLTLAGARGRAEGAERRFESETVRRFAPLLAAYLILLMVWPPWDPFTTPHGSPGLGHLGSGPDTGAILRQLELLAAFTVLGYAVAEGTGRRERSYRKELAWLFPIGAGISLLAEGLASVRPGAGASLVRGALATVAICYGGGIYHLQRSHVRWLLGNGPHRPGPTRGVGVSSRNPAGTPA